MEAWEAWALALSAIAAGTGLISVGFWIVEKVVAYRNRPTLDFHADVVRRERDEDGMCRGMLRITAVGDDVARHVDLHTEDCWLGHHHEEGKLAEMRGGTHVELPLYWRDGDEPVVTMTWFRGPMRRLRMESDVLIRLRLRDQLPSADD